MNPLCPFSHLDPGPMTRESARLSFCKFIPASLTQFWTRRSNCVFIISCSAFLSFIKVKDICSLVFSFPSVFPFSHSSALHLISALISIEKELTELEFLAFTEIADLGILKTMDIVVVKKSCWSSFPSFATAALILIDLQSFWVEIGWTGTNLYATRWITQADLTNIDLNNKSGIKRNWKPEIHINLTIPKVVHAAVGGNDHIIDSASSTCLLLKTNTLGYVKGQEIQLHYIIFWLLLQVPRIKDTHLQSSWLFHSWGVSSCSCQ